MDLDQMAYRCPKAEMVETVRLEGYRLTFAAAGSGLATIFPEEGCGRRPLVTDRGLRKEPGSL
mgnify:CR=1 FL=1